MKVLQADSSAGAASVLRQIGAVEAVRIICNSNAESSVPNGTRIRRQRRQAEGIWTHTGRHQPIPAGKVSIEHRLVGTESNLSAPCPSAPAGTTSPQKLSLASRRSLQPVF
jgi:hypothetical protein